MISGWDKEVFFVVNDLGGARGRGKLWEEVLRVRGVFWKVKDFVRKKTGGKGFRDFVEMEWWSRSWNLEGECSCELICDYTF